MAIKRGELLRLRQGAYVFRSAYESCDPIQRHLLLARAALARQGGSVALTGPSAAAAHGLVMYDVDLTKVHFVRLDKGAPRQESDVVHHAVRDGVADQIVSRQGLPVVNVGRTVWEMASMSSLAAGLCATDSALRLYPDSKEDVIALTANFANRPGSRRARLVLRLADGRSESAGESNSRLLFFRRSFPKPELQHRVIDIDGVLLAICDFYWPEFRHVGEFDGRIKYGRLLVKGQSAADVVFAEKRREDAVRVRRSACLAGSGRRSCRRGRSICFVGCTASSSSRGGCTYLVLPLDDHPRQPVSWTAGVRRADFTQESAAAHGEYATCSSWFPRYTWETARRPRRMGNPCLGS